MRCAVCTRCGKCGLYPSAPINESGTADLPRLVQREGLGAAVDIGSTTIVARVYDLATGELLHRASTFNPQRRIAADVMGRISAAMEGRLDELRDLVRGAVRDCLGGALGDRALPACGGGFRVNEMVAVGNTTMLHLFAGVSPASYATAPFKADRLFGERIEMEGAEVRLPRCAHGFFGADAVAAVRMSGMCERGGCELLADIGTNGEIALWRGDRRELTIASVAAGPAFVTGTVGAAMLGSRAAGWLLFGALTCANLTIGILLRFTDEEPSVLAPRVVKQPFARSFCESVADAGGSMLPLCAWVLLFSGICAVLERTPPGMSTPLICVLEVTNGCRMAAENGLSLPVLAAILGFGGLSVHCQILSDVTACGVRLSRFWAFRVVCGALAAVYCAGLLRLFPQAQTVALLRSDLPVRAVSASVPTSVALLATAAVFILNTAKETPARLRSH